MPNRNAFSKVEDIPSSDDEEQKQQKDAMAGAAAINPEDYMDDLDDDPALKEMEENLKKKMKEVEESDNPHLFTFEDGDTVDFSKPPDTSFADDLEADENGYKKITWTQLKKKFCFERPAHKFKLVGDVSQRPQEHWERSKQIKVRDEDGVEGAVFFYCEDTKPYFDFDDVRVGNNITIKSPRYHRFMDKQEGMRVEEAKTIGVVEKQKFTDAKRLDYGVLNKNHGNQRFKDGKFDDAMEFYDAAINHMRGSFKENPEDEPKAKELVAQCYLNIAACHTGNKNWQYVEAPCQSALRINASQACNAKAYYRMGSACLERLELSQAKVHLERAVQLAPGDPAISAAIDRLNAHIADQVHTEKKLFQKESSQFGLRKWRLSEIPNSLATAPNFRDFVTVFGVKAVAGHILKKNTLYRSSNLSALSAGDMAILKEDLGIKTILDLRSSQEIKKASKDGKKLKGREDAMSLFPSITVKAAASPDVVPSLKYPKEIAGADALKESRVTFHVDVATKAVFSLVPWLAILAFLSVALVPFLWNLCTRLVLYLSVVKAGPLGTYKRIVEKGGPQIREAFRILAEPANYPVVVCCSMGKDRTGIVMMMVDAVLGVSDHHIASDFAETTKNMTKQQKDIQQKMGLPEEWNEASAETALDFLRFLRAEYGSVEGYLTSIGVTKEELSSLKQCLYKNLE